MSLVFWSPEETNIVAKEYVRLYANRVPTWSYIDRAQQILPRERRKRVLAGKHLDAFRERVVEIKDAVEAHEESTASLIGTSIVLPPTNGHAPAAVAAPTPIPAPRVIPRVAAPLVAPPTNVTAPAAIALPPSDAAEQIVGTLVAINQHALGLKSLSLADLEAATRQRIDHMRIRNLIIQASNALTYFEEIIGAAADA